MHVTNISLPYYWDLVLDLVTLLSHSVSYILKEGISLRISFLERIHIGIRNGEI